jgi:hypothetical protein
MIKENLDNAYNLVDMAMGLISLGAAHNLLKEALDEIKSATDIVEEKSSLKAVRR